MCVLALRFILAIIIISVVGKVNSTGKEAKEILEGIAIAKLLEVNSCGSLSRITEKNEYENDGGMVL